MYGEGHSGDTFKGDDRKPSKSDHHDDDRRDQAVERNYSKRVKDCSIRLIESIALYCSDDEHKWTVVDRGDRLKNKMYQLKLGFIVINAHIGTSNLSLIHI